MKISKLITLAILITLTGCASQRYDISIDAIAKPNAHTSKEYALFPLDEHTSVNDLQFNEFAKYIEYILSENGYTRKKLSEKYDVLILIGYGTGDPKTYTRSYSVPVWGQTGYSSSTTTGTINTYGSSSSYTGTTTYTPEYGITGYVPKTYTETYYLRYLSLCALDTTEYKKTKQLPQIWRLFASNFSTSNDIREVFPYFAIAIKDYLGKNTHNKITEKLYTFDDEVEEIKAFVLGSE